MLELARGIGDRKRIFNELEIVADFSPFVNIKNVAYNRLRWI